MLWFSGRVRSYRWRVLSMRALFVPYHDLGLAKLLVDTKYGVKQDGEATWHLLVSSLHKVWSGPKV